LWEKREVAWRKKYHKAQQYRPHATLHKHKYHFTHTRLTALFPGLTRWADTRKVKPIWILLKLETVSGSGISWAICKPASHSRQITMPAPHHSVFLQAGCSSCRPTNSIKALKANLIPLPICNLQSAHLSLAQFPWYYQFCTVLAVTTVQIKCENEPDLFPWQEPLQCRNVKGWAHLGSCMIHPGNAHIILINTINYIYQLSLTDPCNGIMLYTEFDDHYDKLQRSNVGGIVNVNLVDWRRPSLSCSEGRHLSRDKLIAHFDDRYGVAKLSKSGV